MTPSDQQQLKVHLKAAAEILYRNTDPTELKSFETIEKWLFLTYYAKLTIKMPSKQASIFVIIEIPKAIRRTFY